MRLFDRDVHCKGSLVRLAELEGDKYEDLTDPEGTLAQLRALRPRIDIFTFMQTLPHTTPAHRYAMEWDNLAAVPVSTFDEWWTKQINAKTRNMVRRAEKKGVTVREAPFDDELVRGICGIYNESPMRQGKPFWHYGKDFDTIRRISATFLDRSIFIGAFLEGELIGFIKLVTNQDNGQAACMHIVSMIKHRDKAPTNALVAQAVRSCADRGIPYLVYSNFSYGAKQNDSLSDFKEHNGFKRIELPRYYVPLTLKGKIALRLGLHHKIADRLPEPLLARLRKIRSAWYHHKAPISQEAQ
jgi:hypothetical protein